ncbi:protein cereblon-like [Sycon ciliatum]|uniref:protein cereblon-like n=1 Tax=Sycon ciliatum TaxID=27933 RepID=UPI0031F6FC3E|eukprot:scpid86941/ scgid20698/ Protein cereblon
MCMYPNSFPFSEPFHILKKSMKFVQFSLILCQLLVLVVFDSIPAGHGLDLSRFAKDEGPPASTASDFVCQPCRQGLMNLADVIFIPSEKSIHTFNHTVRGARQPITLQHFVNPQDLSFDLVTVSSAHVVGHGHFYAEHSWWPGYSWQVAVCPKCRQHVGWVFQAITPEEGTADRFYGLIFSHLSHNATGDTSLYMTRRNVL